MERAFREFIGALGIIAILVGCLLLFSFNAEVSPYSIPLFLLGNCLYNIRVAGLIHATLENMDKNLEVRRGKRTD